MQHFSNPRDPAQQAVTRQENVDSAHRALEGFQAIRRFAVFLSMCIEDRVWEQPRTAPSGRSIDPMSFHDFIHDRYPRGLNTNYADVELVLKVARMPYRGPSNLELLRFSDERLAALAKDWKALTGRSIES